MKATIKTIGTDKDNDIVLNGKYISAKHAELIIKGKRTYIHDLNSTFKTSINGIPISQETELTPKDRVKLGTQLFHWEDYANNTNKTTPSSSIFLKDLWSPFGDITISDYKFALLLLLGLSLIIPFVAATLLVYLDLYDNTYSKWFAYIFYTLDAYILLNLTQKVIRNLVRK